MLNMKNNCLDPVEQKELITQNINVNLVKDKIKNIVEIFLNNFFEDKFFEVGEKQEWVNNICNGIIKKFLKF